ncbi:glycosyltransferase family 9 protein [Yersinia aldovae]|uniref:Sugar transferase n=1 Tax=Yersinia aldovae TaxID=29483 RepID=A0A0T9T2C8_YERAL|nr:glycosyltransferase family 9 protein [Yersinia aldovae]EEP95585.1 Glycosyl transferase, family 9 [Yersinia aldovae ATCC 35236]CNK55289.1 putative sugar transferase [Yersinia aldovae]CNK57410.1 putative sugar transferase [Yersinia aldovae]
MQRILVIRIDFLGDMVCTTGLLHALKQRWPSAEIHVLANKYNQAVLAHNPAVSAVHTYVYSKQCERNQQSGRLTALLHRLALIRRLRRLRFDLLLIPNGGISKNSIQFARQLNVVDCRWHTAESEFDDRNPSHVANRPIRHEALSGFALIPELGKVDIEAVKLHIYPDTQLQAKWRAELGKQNRPRIGLFISNKSPERRWCYEKWQQLAQKLSDQAEMVILYDPTDPPSAQQLAGFNGRCLLTSCVNEFVAAMSLLDLVISADSSPIHISSALQIPVVALFESRPEKYLRWYPLVRHVLLHAGPQVEDIPVNAVETAARALLANPPSAPESTKAGTTVYPQGSSLCT